MSANLENFRPRLRNGRVIPQGSRIIFETDKPFNQIILPMALADMILLCSGQFTVREILEKIYRKQGLVPFKAILKAIHLLHRGGFFENGEELVLNFHLRSWMEPRFSNRMTRSWILAQRILADRSSPAVYYTLTLLSLVGSLFGLQMLTASPMHMIESWVLQTNVFQLTFELLICTSLVQSFRAIFKAMQLLLLTGKVYNVGFRLNLWGIYLAVGDEARDLFENRLYTSMFHVSQILFGWTLVLLITNALAVNWQEPFLIANVLITFWELNPFTSSEGFKLVQTLFSPADREIPSWHFDSALMEVLSPDGSQHNLEFSRMCGIWGMFWLVLCVAALQSSAVTLGPVALNGMIHPIGGSLFGALAGIACWCAGFYYVVQSMLEVALLSLLRPWLRAARAKLKSWWPQKPRTKWTFDQIIHHIQNLPLFSHFHDKNLIKILQNSELIEFKPDASVIRQGDLSRELFVLLEGVVAVVRHRENSMQEWITEISAVAIFGEAALVEDAARAAQVYARSASLVLSVPVSVIRKVAEESQVVRELDDFRNAILVNQFFSSSPVFRSLSTHSIEFLSSRGSLQYMSVDETVFRQGDLGDSIYLILRGSVEIEVHDRVVKQLYQGSFFGEIALIANIPRTATVRVIQPAVFFKITADAFWEVLVQNMDLGLLIESISEIRLREDLDLGTPLRLRGTGS